MTSVGEVLNSKQFNNPKKTYSLQYPRTAYSVQQTREFVEALDRRLYVNKNFLPFYCKAVRAIGFARVLELQSMVVNDPRIDKPHIFNAEKVFWSLLKTELKLRQTKETN